MMYAIYDETGRIVKSIDCPPDMIERQLSEGQGYIETSAHDGTHYVKDGELITYPERPSNEYQFDFILEHSYRRHYSSGCNNVISCSNYSRHQRWHNRRHSYRRHYSSGYHRHYNHRD
jgi:hypothetical protein